MSVAYTKVLFGLDFIMEVNPMNPDQTDPLGAVWSGVILFAGYVRASADDRENDTMKMVNITNNDIAIAGPNIFRVLFTPKAFWFYNTYSLI